MAKLKIEVGEPRRIEAQYGHFPFMNRLRDGRLILRACCGDDTNATEEEYDVMYSEPEGRRRSPEEILKEQLSRRGDVRITNDFMYWYAMSGDGGASWEPYGGPGFITLGELRDGTLIGFSHLSRNRKDGHTVKTWRSEDGGESWTVHYAPLLGPTWKEIPVKYYTCFHRSVVELEDGSILVAAYDNLDWIPGTRRSRTVIYRSTDRGERFFLYSTVAADYTVEAGRFNEAALQPLDNGDLLCVMRTGAGCPIYQSRSRNGGATWSEPEMTGADGVDPDVVRLSNGVLACSYGRPGVWVMFNADGTGRLWTNRTRIWDTFGRGGSWARITGTGTRRAATPPCGRSRRAGCCWP